MQPRSGLRSSEFWIVIVILAMANMFPIITAQFPENETLKSVAILVAGFVDTLVGLGYVIARTSLKKNDRGSAHSSVAVWLLLAFLVGSLLICGCSPKKEWVRSSEATWDAVGPAHIKYIDADPKLDKDQKTIRKLVITSWKRKNEEWRKEVGE